MSTISEEEINKELLDNEQSSKEEITPKEQMHYILGCVQAKAFELSKEIDVPIEQCRSFLLNQVIKYLKTKSQSVNLEDLIEYGILND